MGKSCDSLASNWILRPKNISIEAKQCLQITVGNISHDMSDENEFTTCSTYKLGLKSPILAEKAQNIVIFCDILDFKTPKI